MVVSDLSLRFSSQCGAEKDTPKPVTRTLISLISSPSSCLREPMVRLMGKDCKPTGRGFTKGSRWLFDQPRNLGFLS